MNTSSPIFSFRRWSLLVIKHWTEYRKKYMLFLLAAAGLLLLWNCFILIVSRLVLIDVFMQFATYYFGLFLVGCLYASSIFADLSSKKDGITWLALPASQLEKLLCSLFFGVLVFFIAYTILFYLVEIPMVQLSNNILVSHPRNFQNSISPIPPSPIYNFLTAKQGPAMENDTHVFLFTYFSTQAVFILGSVYFTRYAFIKSIITVLICFLLYILIHDRIINAFIPDGWREDMFSWMHLDQDGHPDRYVLLPSAVNRLVTIFFQLVPPIIIWTITYFRLKEKEV